MNLVLREEKIIECEIDIFLLKMLNYNDFWFFFF